MPTKTMTTSGPVSTTTATSETSTPLEILRQRAAKARGEVARIQGSIARTEGELQSRIPRTFVERGMIEARARDLGEELRIASNEMIRLDSRLAHPLAAAREAVVAAEEAIGALAAAQREPGSIAALEATRQLPEATDKLRSARIQLQLAERDHEARRREEQRQRAAARLPQIRALWQKLDQAAPAVEAILAELSAISIASTRDDGEFRVETPLAPAWSISAARLWARERGYLVDEP